MKKHHFITNITVSLTFLPLFFIHLCRGYTLFDEQSPNWLSTEAIRSADYDIAIAQIQHDTSEILDSNYQLFKLGCIYQGLGEWSKALFYFRMHATKDTNMAPFSYERIGDIELQQGRHESALKAYRVAVEKANFMNYRYSLYQKMYSIAEQYIDTIGIISWLEEVVEEDSVIPPSSMKLTVRHLIDSGKLARLDSSLVVYLDTSRFTKKQCFLCTLLVNDSLLDSTFYNTTLSTKVLYLLSKLSYRCKKYKIANFWLQKAEKRKNFSKIVPRNKYYYHLATLHYHLKNYHKALKWALKFDKLFGPDPGLVYITARCYRSIGKAAKAAFWYDKHIRLFPYHRKTHDIIWYRAWQKEDVNNFVAARKYYKMLFKRQRKGSKSDDAGFRHALTFCKERNLQTAIKAFSFFLRNYPNSPHTVGAHYWMAKCYFSLRHYASALKKCERVIKTSPTNYYAYRARELMFLMRDSLPTLSVDTTYSIDQTLAWLDSINYKSPQRLNEKDSLTFSLGCRLAFVGMIEQAEYVLEKLEKKNPSNLFLQFELARLYARCNAPTSSFRIAVRFSWRIPSSKRTRMPIQIYALMYPFAYAKYINKYARKFNLEPELISSVIRQESIFNPTILSPVGAIGLMQIMPYTGKEIAIDLKEDFYIDSLTHPSVNIRYGAWYLRKLLNKFNGDLILAVAGYNGGPHNAKRWRAQNSDDGFDMFIEDIGYSETRKYTKKVLGNYWTYNHLKKMNAYYEYGIY